MTYTPEFVRKLTRQAKHSFYVLIPPELIRHMGWRESQKLVVKEENGQIVVDDWKPSKKK
jgi:formylmethanofuran dehydrogenase subunit D